AVYPLIIQNSTNPEAGKIKIVSSRKAGKWMETDHYGSSPMNNWEDVLFFLAKEVDKLRKLNALSHVSSEEVQEYWEEINPKAEIINGPDPDNVDNLIISQSGISQLWNYIDNSEDDPRFAPGYWQPILEAWENALSKIREDYENGMLVSI